MATSVDQTPELKIKKVVLAKQSGLREFKESSHSRYSAVSRVGKYLYVTGTTRKLVPHSGNMLHIMAILDIHLEQWRLVEMEGSTIRSGSTMFLYDDALYSCTGEVSRFDLTLEEWSVYDSTYTKQVYIEGFTAEFVQKRNRLVVFGGKRNNVVSNHLEFFAMDRRRWVLPVIKGMPPSPRRQHGSCVEGDVIYYHGGYTGDSERNPGLYRLEIAQGDRLTWSQVRADNSVLGSLMAFAFASLGRMLLFCGGNRNESLLRHGITMYDQKERVFRTISLSEEESKLFGWGARAFPTNGGRSIGIFGGVDFDGFDGYVEITPIM